MKKNDQLLLFEGPKSEMQHLWEKPTELKESQGKTTRRLFKDMKDLEVRVTELQAENERLRCHETVKWTA